MTNINGIKPDSSDGGKFFGVIFMLAPLIFFYYACKIIFESGDSMYILIPILLFLSVFFFIGLKMFIKSTKIDKIKRLKKTGNGIIKKLKINSFVGCKSNNRGIHSETLLCIEAKDGDKIYYSEPMHLVGEDRDFFESVYLSCGYNYDDNETHKNDVIKVLEERIIEIENKAKSSFFLGKLFNNRKVKAIKLSKELVEKGYQPKHLEIGGKEVHIGDFVNVYIDPNNENIYRIDTNFMD